jgi:hypothetical protein
MLAKVFNSDYEINFLEYFTFNPSFKQLASFHNIEYFVDYQPFTQMTVCPVNTLCTLNDTPAQICVNE